MTQIETFYTNSQLAFAAYAVFTPGVPHVVALQDAGMAQVQAEAFVATFTVVDQYDAPSGVSATIFEQIGTGNRYLAIRGTDGAADLTADYILAAGYPEYLNPQFQQLRLQVQAWVNSGALTNGFTVVGHSLGGYLAGAINTSISQTGDVFMYNAPGVGGLLGNFADTFRAAFGFGSTAPVQGITNIRGTGGVSVIAGIGAQLAPPTFVETESYSNPLDNHRIFNAADSLALYNAYGALAPSLTMKQIGDVLSSASSNTERTYEASLDALRRLLGASDSTIADRNAFYTNLGALEDSAAYIALQGSAAGRVVNATSAMALASEAKQEFGMFLAAYYLLPVTIEGAVSVLAPLHGALHATWQADQGIQTSDARSFTDRWYSDRISMLKMKLKTGSDNFETAESTGYPGLAQFFDDRITGEKIYTGPTPQTNRRYFVFGSDASETDIVGANRGDSLYGGGGDDSLNGGGGNDYLEGNAGDDTLNGSFDQDTLVGGRGNDTLNGGVGDDVYIWTTGDGTDTIIDSDKRGRIFVNGNFVRDLIRTGNTYVSPDGAVSGVRNSPLTLTTEDGATLVLSDFEDADQGLLIIRESGGSDTAPATLLNGTAFNDNDTNQGGQTYSALHGDSGGPGTADEIHGLQGDDILDGQGGEDRLFGDEGRDFLYGRLDDDSLFGGIDGDILLGAEGNDVVVGGALVNDDLLDTMQAAIESDGTPGLTKEFLAGGSGDDVLIGGAGNDALSGGVGIDTLIADGGNDVIWGDADLFATDLNWVADGSTFVHVFGVIPPAEEGEADSIYAGGGDDLVFAEGGDDYVDAGAGNDWVIGHGGADTLFGRSGNDILNGDSNPGDTAHAIDPSLHGDDYLDGEDGNDELVGNGGADILFGGAGNDNLHGDDLTIPTANHGDDYLDGEEGDDQLFGYGGSDTLFGGDGADIAFGEAGDDYLDGEEGSDQLSGGDGADVMFGGAGDDTVLGDGGDDSIDGEDGNDLIAGGAGNDFISGGLGIDELQGGDGDDSLEGGEGGDTLFGEAGADFLLGQAGNDVLAGGAGVDSLEGGDGIDQLFGEGDADTLAGGAGDDTLTGGAGGDLYLFKLGDQRDRIVEDLAVDTEVLRFGSGIILGDLTFSVSENSHLVVSHANGTDEVTVTNWYAVNGSGLQMTRLEFADGSQLTGAEAGNLGLQLQRGTAVGDTLIGTSLSDTLYGLGGGDTLVGNGGADTLVGGTSNDILQGGEGADVFRVSLGDGVDRIQEVGAIDDRLIFGPDVVTSAVSYRRIGNDLVLLHANGTDRVTVEGWYVGTSSRLQSVEFESDGTVLTEPTLTVGAVMIDDQYTYNAGDRIKNIDDWGGVDTLTFGPGITKAGISSSRLGDALMLSRVGVSVDNCIIHGWFSDAAKQVEHILFSSSGESFTQAELTDPFLTLTGTANADVLTGGDAYGEVILGLGGNDQLNGAGGDDTLDGGAGNDILRGGEGSDTYDFGVGSGADTLEETDATGNDADVLMLGGGITSGNLDVVRVGQNLVLTISGTSDQITLKQWFDGSQYQIEQVQFDGGPVWDAATLQAHQAPVLLAPLGDQAVNEDAPFLFMVPAEAFADPEPGVPLTYSASLADGSALPAWLTFDAQTRTFSGTPANADVGTLAVRVTATDPVDESASDVFNLTVTNVNDAPVVANPVADQSASQGEVFNFTVPANTFADVDVGDIFSYAATLADGSALPSWLSFNAATRELSGTPPAEAGGPLSIRITATDGSEASAFDDFVLNLANIVNGTEGDDTLVGTAAADSIFGFEGNDTIDGGAGADTMDGGLGNDVYFADNAGDVAVELEGGGIDTVNSSITYSLQPWVENLTLTGTSPSDGTGNTLDNSITGNDGNNALSGGDGNDWLDGWVGDDALLGGEGNDVVLGWDGNDNLDGGSGDDRVWGEVGDDVLVGGDGNDELVGDWQNAGNDQLFGGDGDDLLYGDDWNNVVGGNDMLDGGSGTDQLRGGVGDDTLYGGSDDDWLWGDDFDSVIGGNDMLDGGSGADQVVGGVGDDTLYGGSGDDQLYGQEGNDLLFGGDGNDTLHFGSGDEDILDGGNGNDQLLGPGGMGNITLRGGAGDDYYSSIWDNHTLVENAGEGIDTIRTVLSSWTLQPNFENLIAGNSVNFNGTGNELDNSITGNSGNDTLTGAAGNDWLEGGAGTDTTVGGTGDDTHVVAQTTDITTENAGEGTDTVRASITWTLGSNLENLVLIETANINGTGNTLANVITGNSGDNVLNGGTGADTLIGGIGNDTYVVDVASDLITENAAEGIDTVQSSLNWTLAADLENLVLTGTSNLNGTGNSLDNALTGNSGNNTLTGGAGNDVLNGGSGTDTMVGGVGDDTYVVAQTSDVTTENANEGTDTVQSSIAWTLGANLENLTLTGTGNINGTGNALNNTIIGSSGNNTLTGAAGNDWLDGGAGTDSLVGGTGDDTYVVAQSADSVTESSGAGTDTVRSSITWTLGSNLENLVLTGTSNINGTGNTLANVITGTSGDNVLNGGTGADTLIGGMGNDTYVVDVASDVITENAAEGIDTVQSSLNWTLAPSLENLTLTGSSAIQGTGNALDNVLTGNSGNNTLTGGAGNDVLNGGSGTDTMVGGLGDDTYVVAQTSDVTTENANEGTDTVQSSIAWTLGANLENLALTGTSNFNGTGNALNNTIIGNSGTNTLNGGAGNDWLEGGAGTDTTVGGTGDDTHVVAQTADITTENAGEGTDTVRASITWTLGANLENLTLTGSSAINGTGNTLANSMTGNGGNNSLTGNAGNDTLDGQGGADTLIGGTGNDTYVLGRGYGADVIQENDSTSGNADTAQLLAGIAREQVWFTQSGNNLVVTIIGTPDQFTVQNWYSGSANHVEEFRTSDGQTLLDSDVQNLVNAMAAFSPPAPGQETLPPDYATALNPVIAAHWQ